MNKILKMIFILVLTSSNSAFADEKAVEKCLQEIDPNWVVSAGVVEKEEGVINAYLAGGSKHFTYSKKKGFLVESPDLTAEEWVCTRRK